MKPNETFNVFNHPPDLAILFKRPGKKAKNANGSAIAIEKPKKPMMGPILSFCWLISTRRLPIKAAVHENETKTKVSAIKKIPENELVLAFESILLVHVDGNVISKAPKNEMPKTINKTKTNKLKAALLDIWYKVSFPKRMVNNIPSMVNMATMEKEYKVAFLMPVARELLLLIKKLTVTGNIAYKHGCKTAIKPHLRPSKKVVIKDFSSLFNTWACDTVEKRIRAVSNDKKDL